MADKEPRRRRRRKEASRKDETSHQDFVSTQHTAPQYKDSDQEQDDEPTAVMPNHEPSKIAQIVFMFFLAVLIVLMGFVFAALKGSTSEQGDNGMQIVDSLSVESIQLDSSDKEATIGIEDVDESIIENLVQYQKDSDVVVQEERVEDSRKDTPVPPADVLQKEDLPVVETVDTLDDEMFEVTSSASADIDSSEMIQMKESEVTVEDTSAIFDADEMDPTESYDTNTELPDLLSSVSDVPVTEAHVPFEMSSEAFDLDIEGAEETTTASSFDSGFDADDDDDDEGILLGTETPAGSHEYSTALPEEDLTYANYEKADITSEGDYEIKEQLDDIDDILEKSPKNALQKYEDLLKVHPLSPRALYGKARALDQLADIHYSNKLLEDAISAYQKVLSVKEVPDRLYIIAGEACAERMQFRGYLGKSIKLLIELSEKFPKNVTLKNKVAVGYLLIGQNGKAKETLLQVLKEDPENGFAKVHLGFILKTVDSKYEVAIELMSAGIASRENGVIDGRFFFHLGDALARVGKSKEAMKVYEDGVKEGLFKSAYQRSLYNVEGLTGKPWWKPESTKYAKDFEYLESFSFIERY